MACVVILEFCGLQVHIFVCGELSLIHILKAGTKDEELAKEFLDYFCKINAIKFDDLPVLEGALTR